MLIQGIFTDEPHGWTQGVQGLVPGAFLNPHSPFPLPRLGVRFTARGRGINSDVTLTQGGALALGYIPSPFQGWKLARCQPFSHPLRPAEKIWDTIKLGRGEAEILLIPEDLIVMTFFLDIGF